MEENERQAKLDRDRQRQVLEDAVSRYEGRVLQFVGDGTLSVFQSAIRAVQCAVEIQTVLVRPPRVPLRIGIHTGDIVHDESGVFGDGVNVSSRIQALSPPGGILISGKVYDEVKNQPEIRTRNFGSFQLKNVSRQMQIYTVVVDQLPLPSESARVWDGWSVVVLPFVNMSADPENEFFCDGITEELINALTRVDRLRVTARTSSFAFKGRNPDVRTIASRLGVKTVLEGSVRRDGNRARITAQLIEAKDGYHIFSENYDRSLDDIFATQDELARTIVGNLDAHFSGASSAQDAKASDEGGTARSSGPRTGVRRAMGSQATPVDAAYSEYLRGRFHFDLWNPHGARKAIAHYERAVALDPTFALPHSGIAAAYAFLGVVGEVAPVDGFPKAERAAHRALDLSDSEGESHLALAAVKLCWHWDLPDAYRSLQRALALIPGSAEAHLQYGYYLKAAGELDAMIEEWETALELDPLSLKINWSVALAYFTARKDDLAREQLGRTLALDPDFRAAIETLGWLEVHSGNLEAALGCFERMATTSHSHYSGVPGRAHVLARLGRVEESRALLALMKARQEDEPHLVTAIQHALVYLGLGELDSMFECLNEAVDRRVGESVFLRTDRHWEDVRRDRRFGELLARIVPARAAVAG